jgi:hypothetical protein
MLYACGDDELLGSARPDQDAGSDASSLPDATAPDATADAAEPKRTVFVRNPFGNLSVADNLLWDGDFEWHSAFASQYGWVDAHSVISTGGFSGVRIGSDCKSGMKCGVLTQNQKVAAIGVSPSDQLVRASIWTKPSTGVCLDARVLLIACDYGIDPDTPVMDADGKPDAEGWCEHVVIAEKRERASCLLVEADFVEGEMIIDDAVVQTAPPGSQPTMAAFVPTPDIAASAETARSILREWLKPGRVPEPEARRAWERWRRRRR